MLLSLSNNSDTPDSSGSNLAIVSYDDDDDDRSVVRSGRFVIDLTDRVPSTAVDDIAWLRGRCAWQTGLFLSAIC